MKEKLLSLIDEIEIIEKTAHAEHVHGFFESDFVIYDVAKFISWKQQVLLELNEICNDDPFIKATIKLASRFNGYTDRKIFDEFSGALLAIKGNIDKYYKQELMEGVMEEIEKMIFISHSSADKDYIEAVIELLEDLGLHDEDIVCSSIPPYCVPLGNKVYEWLVDKFQNYQLHVFFMLSENYYKSPACLNEMGAAWAMKQKWTGILLPEFGFDKIAGCIDSTQISIKLDDSDKRTLKYRLDELKNDIITDFDLRDMSSSTWERKRDKFLNKIEEIINRKEVITETVEDSNNLSLYARLLLVYTVADPAGELLAISTLSSVTISTRKFVFNQNDTPREQAKWNDALDELLNAGYLKRVGHKGEIFKVTSSGYNLADELKSKYNIDTDIDPCHYTN